MTDKPRGSSWDPDRYQQFRAERLQPALDLLALVEPTDAMTVLDLGCGTGDLTTRVADRFAGSTVLGVDQSETMLAQAREHARDGVSFVQADIKARLASDRSSYDLVFSNAALHWLGAHRQLIEAMRARLRPRGQIAVQMPANFSQPTHTTAAALAAEPPYAAELGGRTAGARVEPLEFYAHALHAVGFQRQTVRHHVYLHLLEDREAAFDWVRGSMLSWYRAGLSPATYESFERTYRARLLAALPDDRPFRLTYRRILMWASLGPA